MNRHHNPGRHPEHIKRTFANHHHSVTMRLGASWTIISFSAEKLDSSIRLSHLTPRATNEYGDGGERKKEADELDGARLWMIWMVHYYYPQPSPRTSDHCEVRQCEGWIEIAICAVVIRRSIREKMMCQPSEEVTEPHKKLGEYSSGC
jgi:hypothetical protein